MRTVVSILVVSAVALGSIIGGASAAPTRSASAAAGPQQNVTASLLTRPSGTLAPGTTVAGIGDLRKSGVRRRQPRLRACPAWPGAISGGDDRRRQDVEDERAGAAPECGSGAARGRVHRCRRYEEDLRLGRRAGDRRHPGRRRALVSRDVHRAAGRGTSRTRRVTWWRSSTVRRGASSVATQYVSKDGGKTWHLDNTVGGS